ncbi:MAG: hypothetical protein JWP97_6394 [Labilithrix sp.]|nr:hypothetical protein [Labilithrix sp.]
MAAHSERLLIALLASPSLSLDPARIEELLATAERHGVAGVAHELLEARGVVPPALRDELALRRVARELDHAAHIGTLRRIDAALFEARIDAVVLKGPLFAERFYASPAARATSDIDLLVAERELDLATTALRAAGYMASADPHEAWWRAEHHHIHLESPDGLPLELHFHAYRGFGGILRSEPLIARGVVASRPPMSALRVLTAEDELVYLAVHAAAHRFVRLGWLYDLVLLVGTMTDAALERAAQRARQLGFARPLAFAGQLLVERFGLARAELLGRLGAVRAPVVSAAVHAPEQPLFRAATSFVYAAALCDSPSSAVRYATRASADRARRLFTGER